MQRKEEELLDFLEAQAFGGQPFAELLEFDPSLSDDDGYRLQFGLMKRRVAKGDRIVGFKAANTKLAQQSAGPFLNVGAMLESQVLDDGDTTELIAGHNHVVEPEVAVLLRHDLQGPGVTLRQVYAALEGFIPAIEHSSRPAAAAKRSSQMSIALQKTTGTIVVGRPMSAPNIDLRLEGVMISIDGRSMGTATAYEAMGDPLNVVAIMANKIAPFGGKLTAGMILMTGCLVGPVPVPPDPIECRAEFTRLGSVGLRFKK